MTRIATVPDLVPLLLFSWLPWGFIRGEHNFSSARCSYNHFLCWGFPSGSLRLMVDFPIRCNRSRAYGGYCCCCVIAAPEKHPRSDISPQGPDQSFVTHAVHFRSWWRWESDAFSLISTTVPSTLASETSPSLIPSPSSCSKAKVLCLTALKRRPRLLPLYQQRRQLT